MFRILWKSSGKWRTLSEHQTYARAKGAWFGWMMLVPSSHNQWIIEEVPEVAKSKGIEPMSLPDDGRNPKAILTALEARGVVLITEGENLRRAAGELTAKDRDDVKACKTEIMTILYERHRRATEALPWDGAQAMLYIRKAQEQFKELWTALELEGDEKRKAAFAVLTDTIEMLADAVRVQALADVKAKCDYVEWLCYRVRDEMRMTK